MSSFLRRLTFGGLVAAILGFAFLAVIASQENLDGDVMIGTPEIYTRERLVNDRLDHVSWIEQQLRDLSEKPTEFRSPIVEVETALRVGVFLGKTEQTEPSGQGRHTKVGEMPEEPTLERFQQMNRYRSVLREERTRAMLDDRHDIDGNTLIQLNFDATVISPGAGTGPLAVLRAARLGLGSPSVAAAVIKVSRDPADSETNAWSLYRDWIAVMERELAFAVRQRADALASAVKPVPATVVELLGQLRAAVCADLLALLRDETPRGMEAWPIRLERCLDAVGGMPSSANDSASLALRIVDRWVRLAAQDFEKEARRRYQAAVEEALKLPYLRVLERAYETWRELQTKPETIDSFPEVIRKLTSFDARRDDIACGGPLLTPQFGPEGKFVDLNGRFAFLLGLDLPLGEDGDKARQRHEWTEPEPQAGNDGAGKAPAQHQGADTPPSTQRPAGTVRELLKPLVAKPSVPAGDAAADPGTAGVLIPLPLPCPPVFGPAEEAATLVAIRADLRKVPPEAERLWLSRQWPSILDRNDLFAFRHGRLDSLSDRGVAPIDRPPTVTSDPRGSWLIEVPVSEDSLTCAASIARFVELHAERPTTSPPGSRRRLRLLSLIDARLIDEADPRRCRLAVYPHDRRDMVRDSRRDALGPQRTLVDALDAIGGEIFAYGLQPRAVTELVATRGLETLDIALRITASRREGDGAGSAQGERILRRTDSPPILAGFTTTPKPSLPSSAGERRADQKKSTTPSERPAVRSAVFGWVFAPASGERMPGTAAHSLGVMLSVPAWWRSLEVEAYGCWLPQEYASSALRRLVAHLHGGAGDMPGEACRLAGRHIVRLPAGTTEFLRALRLEIIQTPYLKIEHPTQLRAIIGQPASFRIEGGRLWRSPLVTLGGQTASRVRVLPNMMGIIAEFDCVEEANEVLPSPRRDPPQVIGTTVLRVFTSEGATAPLPVTLLSAAHRSMPSATQGAPPLEPRCPRPTRETGERSPSETDGEPRRRGDRPVAPR